MADFFQSVRTVGRVREVLVIASVVFVALALQLRSEGATAQTPRDPDDNSQLAPVLNETLSTHLPGRYIVVFKPGTARNVVLAAQTEVEGFGAEVVYTYGSALLGFSIKMPADRAQAERAYQAMRALPGVAYIEADQKFSFETFWNQPPDPGAAPPTGLDRISQRHLPLDNRYTYDGAGFGAHAYVIDSGIWIAHTDFEGRAISSFSVVDDFDDCLGHGTHVAGTIGGAIFGVAKGVTLHSVRIGDESCDAAESAIIAGIDWVTGNHLAPAVANMSIGGPASQAMDTAVTNSIASGVTYVVAGGNNHGADACSRSPGRVPNAITVGAIDPSNDTRAGFSNIGTCLDLFAPGVHILSAMPDGLPALCPPVVSSTPGTRSQSCSGTSMAAPHVTGVAARYLADFPRSTPAQVWAGIDRMANVSPGTTGWPGIANLGADSPNKLLVWRAVDDAFLDGLRHITTVRGAHYDFQEVGEYVALRNTNGLQIQIRQTPVAVPWQVAGPDAGMGNCVGVNTGIAVRVGKRRVTYQSTMGDTSGGLSPLLHVDGEPITLGEQGVSLGPGGRVTRSAEGNGIEIDFPDGTNLIATPNFLGLPHAPWFLNLQVFHAAASEGLMGAHAPGDGLPTPADAVLSGSMPVESPQGDSGSRDAFANAWRVGDKTSLFDQVPGLSATTFTHSSASHDAPACVLPVSRPETPVNPEVAKKRCRAIVDEDMNANCILDVMATGEPGIAKAYQLSQRIRDGATRTTVKSSSQSSRFGDPVTFTAAVARSASQGAGVPAGTVQFTVDGYNVGKPIKLDPCGRAAWTTSRLRVGDQQIAARYTPTGKRMLRKRSVFLPSSSMNTAHVVGGACVQRALETTGTCEEAAESTQ